MRALPTVVLVASLTVGCSPVSNRPQAPAPEPAPPVQAADAERAETLMSRGAAAATAGEWAEAERLFAAVYELTEGAQRQEVAFYWGFALFRQGEAIARSNPEGRPEAARRALEYFEQARAVLQRAEHPSREQVLRAIKQYLAPPLIANRRE